VSDNAVVLLVDVRDNVFINAVVTVETVRNSVAFKTDDNVTVRGRVDSRAVVSVDIVLVIPARETAVDDVVGLVNVLFRAAVGAVMVLFKVVALTMLNLT
jgi:hypothetical protein